MQSTTSSTRTFMTTPANDAPDSHNKRSGKSKWLKLPWLVAAVLLIVSGFLFWQYQIARHKLNEASKPTNISQLNNVVARVSRLIVLPKNENPNLLTVRDASKLKGEQFYANAQNGDITLIYSKEQKAILYRPSANIIVNVASITINKE